VEGRILVRKETIANNSSKHQSINGWAYIGDGTIDYNNNIPIVI